MGKFRLGLGLLFLFSVPWLTAYGLNKSLPPKFESRECIRNFDSQKDYFPVKTQVKHAQRFTVTYHKYYKLVTINSPWKGGKQLRYALVMCGAPVPSGYDQVFTIPARSIVALSTTYLTHLENLGVVDKIKGIGLAHYVYSQRIHNQIAAGKTIALGQGSTLNQEALFLLKPDVVFTYGTGNPNTDVLPVLRKGNLPVAIVAEYREPSPLARTEWIKFLALFFNAEEKADRYFHQVEKRYQQLKQLTQNVKKRPTVMAGFSYQGVWYVPGGKTYPAQLLADAGANYLWANDASKESLQLSFEDVLLKGQQAEYWVNGDQTWRTVKDILKTDDRYSQFRAVQNRNVYLANKRLHEKGANDFWESGVANPHLILADLIKIFHPQLLPDHELVYYQKIQP